MSYKLELTNEELSHIEWLTRRGYFPEETYYGMDMVSDGDPLVFEIPEHAAWAITQAREEDTHGEWLFACTGGPLLEKLLKLEQEIV